jgi:hypothetical protein
MSVVRQRTNERRIPGRGPLDPLGPALTAVCALEIFKGGGYRIWLSRAA